MEVIMPSTVQDWMSSPVIVVDPDCSVSYALTLMRRRNIHSVVVDARLLSAGYGIVTVTDIRDKIIASGRNPAETRAQEIMTTPLVTGRPGWTLVECSLQMQRAGIHHLPITDDQDVLVGLISTTDLFIAAEEIGWDK